MSKHTPAPWELTGGTFVYALNSYGTNSFWANIYAGSQGGYRSGATPNEEIEANARLIAAAPDLLDALEGLLDNEKQASFEFWLSKNSPHGDCESVHSQWLESSEYHDFLDLYDSEIAAIAKARGEA